LKNFVCVAAAAAAAAPKARRQLRKLNLVVRRLPGHLLCSCIHC
jgi:hypothetical protein